ncbi:tRNA (adenosine(37)-N6)-threonylcarbamoyltransferase complex dimerization subunit type 1 TsaB [Pseudanabaena sp. FACHB-2040]|uniref:tRNA (adenosine(37)-N6)-threonylcarbamoyltransferase complex dimerization subunit type 1 TsaB n=1 Tax=Pseudanabaena sp. FACHB-2040 TaxID=2692859 RepID=UPI00168967B3|nr:tRNA (adenosine(37)-N6)-threonylcarbamoyltransferase complex dimerization subunit type 1 TsaB [Pseudanabaena sp. FACHB-2040]MBD2259510.1 tRNA (adenosine(37)-N6)-threonylcarbamoyltransferase complex dimerization subunit type 1 TsaB [Pseudanabaena sp. FACHB-2040]
MLGLAIHTSGPELGLALSDGASINRHQVWPFGRDLAAHLHTCLLEFLEGRPWSDLTFLAVAIGPGGFTGTRIGVVAARTLAQQLDIPLFGVSSLAALAESKRQAYLEAAQMPLHLAVEMPAQRGDRFGAIYQLTEDDLVCQLTDQVFTAAAWEAMLTGWPYPYEVLTASAELAFTVPQVLMLAQREWSAGKRPQWPEVLPFYGQHPVD